MSRSRALFDSPRRAPRLKRAAVTCMHYLLLVAVSAVLLFPSAWLVSTSLKDFQELKAVTPSLLPAQLHLENYIYALTGRVPFGRMILNSAFVSALYVLGSVISSSLVGYGFARLRFPGRDALFGLLLTSMMVPFIVRIVPLFLIFRQFGWINTYYPLIVPAMVAPPFFVFVMRQFLRSIPQDLSDAARIDGCSELGIWARLMLPMSKPALAAVAILAFQDSWSDYLGPMIFLNDLPKMTVMVGLGSFLTMNTDVREWHLVSAVTVVVTLPMMLIYLAFQRAFVQGMALSGLKG